MNDTFYRFAVYLAPAPESALATFGNAWLGRDPGNGEEVERPRIKNFAPERIAGLTTSPSRYGFHGTLKPPFRLADGTSYSGLRNAVLTLAGKHQPIAIEQFEVRHIGRFAAIVPKPVPPGIVSLANDCVMTLDGFRAPPSQAELARRRAQGLSTRQEQHLNCWGYPYVLDEFRYHMTLTNALDKEVANETVDMLRRSASDSLGPHTFQHIVLFGERVKGADFEVIERIPLGSVGH